MEYWGDVNRYTNEPNGIGFAIATKFKKICYIGSWKDGLLKGWGQKYIYHPTIAGYEILWGKFTGAKFNVNDRLGP